MMTGKCSTETKIGALKPQTLCIVAEYSLSFWKNVEGCITVTQEMAGYATFCRPSLTG